ncbi:doxx family protein [Malaciobacter molluscorum LMG 25693]|uniref:Doxx family protein n=1 Tax=Malaciobacter molluscorum LMG 25693 TaxID=870501 RepID=A0A2G1DLL8_9BACT|nr:DoxX family protein [Malaciobacter molluscorum]AXX92174.1 putative membrane protein [Malaciobacter molluscorum LMG 25693]PHO19403.1 doxx family protein [Malaciobacter molluscorum LMG 25693]RXJ96343.1 doxx family protein [Malaciobacter molluscorum]
MQRILLLGRISLGIIFIWYGILKFFPQLSPAEALATHTINILFMNLIPASLSIKLLAFWEVFVGVGLVFGIYLRVALILFFVHMSFTFTPLFILPELSFTKAPYAFTLVGQYIVKNVVFILMGILIYKDRFCTQCCEQTTK